MKPKWGFWGKCRSGEEQSHKSPTPGGGPDEYRRAVKSILIYLENTYGPMTSALTLSASEHADVRPVSYDVRHTDEQRFGPIQ